MFLYLPSSAPLKLVPRKGSTLQSFLEHIGCLAEQRGEISQISISRNPSHQEDDKASMGAFIL